MKIIIYESGIDQFFPLVTLKPQYNLLIGDRTVEDHLKMFYPGINFDHIHRSVFGKVDIAATSALYVCSRLLLNKKIRPPKEDSSFAVNGKLVGFYKSRTPLPKTLSETDEEINKNKRVLEIDGIVLAHPWDFIKENESLLGRQRGKANPNRLKGIEIIGDRKNVNIERSAKLSRMIAIDVTDGPVKIAADSEIRPFSTIIGPAYIGRGTIIDGAKITKSSIGEMCRIGGEVEASIFQGFSNKHHEGFIGHSIIGEWVNLGALTTNSDLKNNYRPVNVILDDKQYNTGMTKVGCFIGDHTKTGIGTLITTGAMIGSFVNFFGGGMMPRYVADFRWVTGTKQVNYDLEQAIQTARTVMMRRKIEMTAKYEKLIRQAYPWPVS